MPDIFISPEDTAVDNNKNNSSSSISSLQPKKAKGFDQLLSSFIFMPQNMRFENQQDGENIILFLRKHWLSNLSWILSCLMLLLMPLFVFPSLYFSGLIPVNFPDSFINFIILLWYLAIFSYALLSFLVWYFTVSIVTEHRVVDVDFINILHKKSAETRISKVEDVTERTGGFIRSLFDYGDVFLQTAAKDAVFQFEAVPHPARVVKIVNNLLGKSEEHE